MAFAARNEEGVWRLCLRKGITFTHFSLAWEHPIEICFKNQASAKACADELNEKCWDACEASRPERKRMRQEPPIELAIEIIRRHNGMPDWETYYE